ncbi:MAG TPA: hypothetical protein VKV80_04240 [Streptosporangiaceae bacterium]|nr:hypothetical protein [Streptosporangiaceae bacterium]
MSLRAGTDADRMTSELPGSRVRGLRRASLAAFMILLIQYGFGIYVNLYVTVPGADHGQGIGKAISDGPAALSVHAVLGILLILSAIGVLVQAVIARHWAVLVVSAVALAAIGGAFFQGASFVSQGHDAASMGMAALAGIALLCYGMVLYLLPSPRRP